MMRIAFGPSLPRGVYVAPWMGPNSEIVLVAITRDRKLAGEPLIVPKGADHVAASDEMWARLDGSDPIPSLKIV